MEIATSEWEIMRVIWSQGPSKSSTVYQVLHDKLGWSESTVKTLLARLVSKGALTTKRFGRSFIYEALVDEDKAFNEQLELLFGRLCQTKHAAVIEKLLDKLSMTRNDIDGIEQILLEKQNDLVSVVICDCFTGQCTCRHICERK
ncbi:CopY/TcrY family copper transport repressor [Streptococcus fryi]